MSVTDIRLLKLEHVDLEKGTIYIPSSHKSNSRILELKPVQILPFMEYITTIYPNLKAFKGLLRDDLFIGNTSNLMKIVLGKLKDLDEDLVSLHHIRASVIVNWLHQYSIRKAQVLAGHRYISSTEAYLRNSIEDLHEVVKMSHPLR